MYRRKNSSLYNTVTSSTARRSVGLYSSHNLLFSVSLTLREERRLKVFENRVLRRVFVFKRDEVTGEWRKLHNSELDDLYSYPILCGW
jgi:hypothetical protein